jgi:hypothetical protein
MKIHPEIPEEAFFCEKNGCSHWPDEWSAGAWPQPLGIPGVADDWPRAMLQRKANPHNKADPKTSSDRR